jgi:hypothetical protein
VCNRTAVPFIALLSSAVLAIVLVVQTSLACTDKVALPIPGDSMSMMPGMDMTAMPASAGQHVLMVCPIVLGLIVATALLTAAGIALLWRDPHRALTQQLIVRGLAHLPPVRAAGVVALTGGSAVAGMLWLERSGPLALSICMMLIALLAICALSATLFTIAAGRVMLALGRRLILAIIAAVAEAAAALAPCPHQLVPVVAAAHAFPLLAAGRGLRAPPASAR